jgi:hypothetical protein
MSYLEAPRKSNKSIKKKINKIIKNKLVATKS